MLKNPEVLSRWHAFRAATENVEVVHRGAGATQSLEQAAAVLATLAQRQQLIDKIAEIMKLCSDYPMEIGGHTDSQGDDTFNMKLSEERANTVKNTLIKMGISADRITSKGWGESKPISNNASPEDMANNRRVEFVKI